MRPECSRPPGNCRTEKSVAFADLADGFDHFGRRGLLEQITRRARPGQLMHILVVAVGRQHEHFGGGDRFDDLPGGFQAVEQRHGDVHHDDVRPQFVGQLHGLAAGFGFAHHHNIRLDFQQCAQTLTDDGVIIDEQDGNFFHNHNLC